MPNRWKAQMKNFVVWLLTSLGASYLLIIVHNVQVSQVHYGRHPCRKTDTVVGPPVLLRSSPSDARLASFLLGRD